MKLICWLEAFCRRKAFHHLVCDLFSLPSADAYRALELMEHYLRNLEDKPDSEELRQALTKAIVTIRSRLFQALLGEWRAGLCSLRGEGEEGRIRFVKRGWAVREPVRRYAR